MSIHRCPDCSNWPSAHCKTCKGSRYVHRNSHGRITHPASAADFMREVKPLKKRQEGQR
jgi:hypothetical protein